MGKIREILNSNSFSFFPYLTLVCSSPIIQNQNILLYPGVDRHTVQLCWEMDEHLKMCLSHTAVLSSVWVCAANNILKTRFPFDFG